MWTNRGTTSGKPGVAGVDNLGKLWLHPLASTHSGQVLLTKKGPRTGETSFSSESTAPITTTFL
jgi:hypothetical protein